MSEELLIGVREDLYSFISQHCDKKSFKFEHFMDTWKTLKFYHIFSGRPTLEEMEFFMEHALMYAKDLFLKLGSIGDLERTSSLYLLYALYINQPLVKRIKIRIELEEMIIMQQFAVKMKKICMDIPFAFFSLMKKDAFHYVYSYLNRAPDRKGFVNVREKLSKKSTAENVPYSSNINIVKMLEEIGFNSDQWNHIEALYNSDIADLKEKSDYGEFEKLDQCTFLSELQSVTLPSESKATISRATRKKNIRFEKILDTGIDLPSTSKEFIPEASIAEISKSLPHILNSEESNNDSYDEEETLVPLSEIKSENIIKTELADEAAEQ